MTKPAPEVEAVRAGAVCGGVKRNAGALFRAPKPATEKRRKCSPAGSSGSGRLKPGKKSLPKPSTGNHKYLKNKENIPTPRASRTVKIPRQSIF